MPHTCHAHGCSKAVPARMLMCAGHWKQVRRPVQDAIWREFRSGQEKDKRPSARYMTVQRLAVAEVAFRPMDEEAARVTAAYMVEAMTWRQRAIDAGHGDPLEGLVSKDVLKEVDEAREEGS